MCVRENTQRSCRSIQYSVDLLLSVYNCGFPNSFSILKEKRRKISKQIFI